MKILKRRRKLLKYQLPIFISLFILALLYAYISYSWQSDGIQDHRRLSSCTQMCDPYGGPISITGAMAGQCDCSTRDDGNGGKECNTNDRGGVTCCASIDNVGGVILYFLVSMYTFLGLAIICDDYFCISLEVISDVLSLSEDVAGATFMAAGSSAPELFTAIVTVLITGGSEGLGAIVGSAVFNIMIIVGITSIVACEDNAQLKIWWFPLTRDCIVYMLSIVAMVVVMLDREITWWEGLILICGYIGYILLMVYNKDIVTYIKENFETTNLPIIPGRESGGVQMKRVSKKEEDKEEDEEAKLRKEEELVQSAILAIRNMSEMDLSQGGFGGNSSLSSPPPSSSSSSQGIYSPPQSSQQHQQRVESSSPVQHANTYSNHQDNLFNPLLRPAFR